MGNQTMFVEWIHEVFAPSVKKYLPPNTTPLIQPMYQEVIANFKKLYTKVLFHKCFHATNDTQLLE